MTFGSPGAEGEVNGRERGRCRPPPGAWGWPGTPSPASGGRPPHPRGGGSGAAGRTDPVPLSSHRSSWSRGLRFFVSAAPFPPPLAMGAARTEPGAGRRRCPGLVGGQAAARLRGRAWGAEGREGEERGGEGARRGFHRAVLTSHATPKGSQEPKRKKKQNKNPPRKTQTAERKPRGEAALCLLGAGA